MDDERPKVFQQILSQNGGPAFVRRGRDVQLAFDAVVETCLKQREQWLKFVRLSLGTLYALAGSTAALDGFLGNPEQLQALENLMEDLQPQLRVPPPPTSNASHLRQALAEVRDTIERFNERWRDFIARLDLDHVNEIREHYNRYYLLEKECALGSSRVARAGFQKLNPLQPDDFLKILPLLPVP
jgi:hypothetical protein